MKNFKRYGLPAILTAIFLYLLFENLGSVDLKKIFLGIKLRYLLISFGFYLVAVVLRGLRIALVYADDRPPFLRLLAVSSVHTFISNVLPSRLGEVSFIYLMRRFFGHEFKKNTFVLIFLRLLDLFVVVSFFIISALVVGFKSLRGKDFLLVFSLALILGFLSFYLASFIEISTRLIKFLLRTFYRETRSYAFRVVTFFESLSGIALIKDLQRYLETLVLSVVIWIFLFISGYFLTQAFGFHLSLNLFVFGSTSAVLTSLIPMSSFASFGTYELGWLGAYTLAGLGGEAAILTGLSLHVFSILFSLFFAVAGLLIIRLSAA